MKSDDPVPESEAARALAPLPSENAFVVQFGRDTDPGRSKFVGQVEHLVSARQGRFSDREELLAFFAELLAAAKKKT